MVCLFVCFPRADCSICSHYSLRSGTVDFIQMPVAVPQGMYRICDKVHLPILNLCNTSPKWTEVSLEVFLATTSIVDTLRKVL